MKTLITLLLSCLPVLAANRAVVVSTSTNAVIAPTTFGLQLLTNANAGELLSLIGAVTETNVAQLNQSQTWTGTPTFPAAFVASNNIGTRILYAAPTLYFTSLATAVSPTNNGDFSLTTPLLEVTLPALLSSNSSIFITCQREHPAQTAGGADLYFYVGGNTNYVGALAQAVGGTVLSRGSIAPNHAILVNASAFTNQYGGAFWSTAPIIYGSSNFCDTSAPFKIYLGMRTTTSFTNLLVSRLRVIEIP